MPFLQLSKSKIFIIVLFLFIGIFTLKISQGSKPNNQSVESPVPSPSSLNESPRIVSTKPDPLDNTIISASEIVEITFNRSIENIGEFKSRIEPKIEYTIELVNDRKTARIMPVKPYQLGTTYTLFINPDTKFDGVGEWKQSKDFHFRTITYRGV